SRLDPPSAPTEIVIAEADTPTARARVLEIADAAGAKLIVGTLPSAPETPIDRLVGPVEISDDGRRARSIDWPRGGHLSFQPEIDGVIRRDAPVRIQGAELPSLPLYAARAADPSIVDTGESRLLRWPRADALSRLPAAPSADELKGRIVVVGSFEPRHATPFGFVATPELVAQMLASHLGRHY